MIEAANLAWQVAVSPAPGARRLRPNRETYDRYLVWRDPTGSENSKVVLGSVGSRYVPLQNTDAFSFFDPFIRNGWASFHTAGALGNGERVWVQAKLRGQIVITPEDAVDKFLLLSNSHDGSGAVGIRFTPIRVVCQNTLNCALEGGSAVISVRHTRNIAENLKKAQAEELKHVVDKVVGDADILFRRMAGVRLMAADTDRILGAGVPSIRNPKDSEQGPRTMAPHQEHPRRPRAYPAGDARYAMGTL